MLVCFAAQIALAMARNAGIGLGETEKVQSKLRPAGMVLDSGLVRHSRRGRGPQFAAIPDDTPLGEIRRLIPPGGPAFAARVRLSRRNDQAHLRPVPSHELAAVIEAAIEDLGFLRQANFMVDMPLIHVVSSR